MQHDIVRGLLFLGAAWLLTAQPAITWAEGIAGDASTAKPVQLQLPPARVEGLAQPSDPGRTGVILRAAGENSPPIWLPVTADSTLWKNGSNSQGASASVLLRDNRFSQGLIKIDVAGAPLATDFHAVFHFQVGGVERKGQPAAFSLHRVLADWSEDATWHKPFPDRDVAWSGLRTGVDYEAQPFARWETKALNDGQIVEIEGMEKAVQAWRDASWKNHGFLLLFNGRALQCTLPSREKQLAAKSFALAGASSGQMLVVPDLTMLRQVLLKPDDVLEASLQLTALKSAKGAHPGTVTLQVFRALRPISDRSLQPDIDYDPRPIASCSVPEPSAARTAVSIPGLADALRHIVRGEWKETELLILAAAAPGGAPLLIANTGKEAPTFVVTVRPAAHALLFDNDVKPQPGVYATMRDGHLYYGERRLRLWGVVGYPTADRLMKMGFNAQRVWNPDPRFAKGAPGFYSAESIKRGEPVAYKIGDGSKLDVWDKHFADLKAHGMFVMFAALQSGMPVEPLADDDSFIAPAHDDSGSAADWSDWKKAVLTPKANFAKMVFVDERLQAIRKRAATNLLMHVNLYTGKPYGQEEIIACYEIFNENGFTKFALEGGCESWPPYFQAKFKQKWHEWLLSRYAGETALVAAWGKLDDGESLQRGTVKPGPTLEKRAAYSKARSSDFVRFTIDLVDRFHQDFRAYCRTLAPVGVGVNVAPFSFDTQYRPCLPWNYTNSRGDVNSFGMYFWDLSSSLGKPPSAYVIDSNTTEAAATILYETNSARPNPFRAEYPLKLATLAAWQDWDGVFWHYWSPNDESDESYYNTALQYPNATHYWSAVQHQNDPVMCSSMSIAGRIFLNHHIHAAPHPAIAAVGGQSLFGYDNYNGIGVSQQTFAGGAKTRFEPQKQTGVTIDGKPPKPSQPLTGPVVAGNEILWDWPHGRLIVDSPTAKIYAGKFSGPYRFRDGIVLGDVSTPSVSFAMVSADGKPLTGPDSSGRVCLAAVADARNTDFKFNWSVQGGPLEQAAAVQNRGHAPIIVDKVDYTVWFPTSIEGRLNEYDFALRTRVDAPIARGNRIAFDAGTMYMSVLTIDRRGAPAAVPDATGVAAGAADFDKPTAASDTAATTPASGSLGPWHPIAVLNWEMTYDAALKHLRASKLVTGSISARQSADKESKTITLSDAEIPAFWSTPTDVDIAFDRGRMQTISATPKQPPPFGQAIADFEKRFGPASQKQTGAQFERSLARWDKAGSNLTVTLTESQGTMKILFERKPLREPR